VDHTAPPILVVTPDPRHAPALADALQHAWPVKWVPDGQSALMEIARQLPRLVLLTADMPGLSGLQVCQLLRQEGQIAKLPVVLIYFHGHRLDELLSHETDADLHLSLSDGTPFDSPEVLERLRPLLERPVLPPLPPEASARLAWDFTAEKLLPRIAGQLKDTLLERTILRALAVTSTKLHDLPTLIMELLLLCGDVLEFDRAGLYLYETRTLYSIRGSRTPEADPEFQEAMLEQAEIFSGLMDFSGKLTELPLGVFPGGSQPSDDSPAFFAVPLQADEDMLGVIGLQTSKAYSRRDYYLRTLGLLAQQITLALASALLYQRVQNLSRIDELTQLYNRRAFFERAREEVVRHRRNGKALTMLLSDIDFFKKVNDTYGHQQGDWVLKETARIFQDSLRAIDVPGRLGGEEYAVLLPETNSEGGLIVAERLRHAIESHAFTAVAGDIPLRCTVSVGVATWDGSGDCDAEALLAAADAALYEAKHSGRNRVMLGSYTSIATGA